MYSQWQFLGYMGRGAAPLVKIADHAIFIVTLHNLDPPWPTIVVLEFCLMVLERKGSGEIRDGFISLIFSTVFLG